MTKKDAFINMVEEILDVIEISSLRHEDYGFDMAMDYFEELKENKASTNKIELTENGAKILAYMQENSHKYNNIFKSKEIAEGLFVSSRSVSGSMKKLITEGFVEKVGSNPTSYSITDKGKERILNTDKSNYDNNNNNNN